MIDFQKVINYTKDLKILYVEDDESLLQETKELFENFFKEVIIAKDGLEGLEIYKKESFDLVFSDIKMPKMDGIELSRNIMELNSDQVIIIISAYNDADKLLSLIQIGISDFLLKPMNLEQLLKVLYKVSKNIYNHKKQQEFLMVQSRLAMMGEMVDMTAHQWLQYLNVLNLKTELLKMENDHYKLTHNRINSFIKEVSQEIDGLVFVLNEFRDFFKQKPKTKISLKDVINSVLVLLKDYLVKNLVEITSDLDDIQVVVYPNEFKQVILNIITNMVENFVEREIENREIFISSYQNNGLILKISDNGGGIDETIIDEIFDARFTTKKNGTGIGLYLSKIIIDKIGGNIEAININNGVEFKIKLKD